MKREILTESEKGIFPNGYDPVYLFEPELNFTDGGLEVFYFKNQDYLNFPEFRKEEIAFYCFHLSKIIHDDSFYQGGFEFICWIARYARNNGFIGYYKEIDSKEVNLIFVNEGEVTVQQASMFGVYDLKPGLFDLPPVDKQKKRMRETINKSIERRDFESAKKDIKDLVEIYPNDLHFQSLQNYIDRKLGTRD